MGPTTFKHFLAHMLCLAIAMIWLVSVTYGLAFFVVWLNSLNPEIKKLESLIFPALILIWLGIFLKVMYYLDNKKY
jgi:hypothetical protein